MSRGRRPLASVFLVACFAALSPAVEIPSIAPQVSSVFPHGGRKGTSVEMEMRGMYLDGASALSFSRGGLTAEILSSQFRMVRARVQVAPDAEAGRHDFRLVCANGAFLGVFWVGTTPEVQEKEPNDRPAGAETITPPVVINGRADAADADHFRFHAEPGETFVFDINAARSGSALDPVLTLVDLKGREIDYCDDYYSTKDAQIVHTFSKAGDYVIRVTASFERSARDAEYRLTVTNSGYATYSLPLGGTRGRTLDLRVTGFNLGSVDGAWLDRTPLHTALLSHDNNEARLQVKLPESLAVGTHTLHVSAKGQEIPASLPFEISDVPEVSVTDAEAASSAPFTLHAPVIVNGSVARVHWFEFSAKAGERFGFDVNSWALGMRFDPVITLFDEKGNRVAQEDDPAPNSFIHHPATHDPRLVYVFPRNGTYRLQVRDAAYQGGPGAMYRLRIQPLKPDFEVDVRTPQVTLYKGQPGTILTVVRRSGGVHRVEGFKKPDSEIEQFRLIETDGWNTPVTVWAEGLPAGVTGETARAEPKNTVFKGNDGEELFVDGTLAEIPLRAGRDAKPGLYEVRVLGEGSFSGEKFRRGGRVLFGALRGYRGEATQEQKLLLNVVDAPPVLISTPGEVRISRGKTVRIKVGMFRFDSDPAPVEIEAKSVPGWLKVEPVVVNASVKELEIPVTVSEGAVELAPVELVLVGNTKVSGRAVRVESPPIDLRVEKP